MNKPVNLTIYCPQCNSTLKCLTNFSICIVCPQCHSVVDREKSTVLNSSVNETIPEDMSPVAIGTTGKWRDGSFEIVGRIKFVSGKRYTNQWVLSMSDGSFNWLGEGYGFYSLFKKDSLSSIPANFLKIKKAGESFKSLSGQTFFVDNILMNKTRYCEGELPEEVLFSREFISIESTNSKLEVALINVYSKTEIHYYSGNIVTFDQMNFKNLRDLNGWI
jgi:DNA-directed RNA polymerase subunit M/transcription elongation factor TFIIS